MTAPARLISVLKTVATLRLYARRMVDHSDMSPITIDCRSDVLIFDLQWRTPTLISNEVGL